MRRSLFTAVVLAVALLAGAQEAAAPAAPPTPAELDQAIEDFARQIPAGISADRYAAFAVAMPANFVEYAALNKHALLVVAALSKDPSELPLKRVYLEQEKRTLELSLVAQVRSELRADSPAGKLMGTHRVDAYYLIPLSAWRQPGTLLADFAAHRKEFILGKFPQEIKEEFIRYDQQPEPTPGRIAPEAIRELLERAAPGKVPGSAVVPGFLCPVAAPEDPHPPCLPASPERVRLSPSVVAGMLLHAEPPNYPPAAKANHVEGTVVLHAVIGKDGKVHDIQVLSGDSRLAEAAVEAVKQWRYRPFRLNGEPVEVDTQITIVFQLH